MKKIISFTFSIFLCLYSSSCTTGSGKLPPGTMPTPNYFDPTYQAASKKLPETTALEKELRQIHKSLAATSTRVKKAKKTLSNGRYAAEASIKMISQIRSVEKQISRLERELKSISQMAQFRALKPVAKAVARLNSKVKNIREKAEKLRDKKIKPAVKKMKKLEVKLAKLNTGLRYASFETVSAVRHINHLKKIVISQQYADTQVRALEALSTTTRAPVTPAKNALYEFDSACTDLENQVNAYKAHMKKLTSLKPGLDKVKAKMKPIDRKVKGIAKVLDKKLGFKIPFSKGKRVFFTVRQVLETPGKVLDIAVKPLTKIAQKLLKPLTKNLKFDIKAPKELQQISAQLNTINRFSLNIDRPTMKLDTNTQAIGDYRTALKKLSHTKIAYLSK